MELWNLLNKQTDRIKREVSYNDKTFILSMEDDMDKLMDVLCRKFNVDKPEDCKPFEIHHDDIRITVERISQSMGEDEAEFIKSQTSSIYNHFYKVDTQYTDIKTNLLYSINLTKSMIFINYSFHEGDEDYKKAFIEQTFASVLNEMQGIMLIRGEEEDGFYCQSPDEKRCMELILSDKGNSTLLNYVPFEKFELSSKNKEISDEQITRRERTRNLMLGRYIYVPADYPVIEGETKAKCRSAEEIAERAVALMIVSAYSEYRIREDADYEEAYNFASQIIKKYDADKMFSPKERKYLSNQDPTREELIAHAWQYESIYVMEWALGLLAGAENEALPKALSENKKEDLYNVSVEDKKDVSPVAQNTKGTSNNALAKNWNMASSESGVDKLDFPDHVCDIALTINLLKQCGSISEIVKKADLKSNKELLDECDLISCLEWSCADTTSRELPSPSGMINKVVVERYKALNWLIGAGDREEWDEIGEYI